MPAIDDMHLTNRPESETMRWRVLVVDDDPDMLLLTSALLEEITFEGHKIELSTARSAAYARKLLQADQGFAVVIMDVVMESPKAGLELVEFLRFEQNNHLTRIVLRTARADQAPAWDTVCHYEIDAYVDKTDPSPDRFLTSVGAALRAFEQLQQSALQRDELAHALSQRNAMQQELWKTQKLEALSKLNADLAKELTPPLRLLSENCSRSGKVLGQLDKFIESHDSAQVLAEMSHELTKNHQKIISASQHLQRVLSSLNIFIDSQEESTKSVDSNALVSDVIAFLRRQSSHLRSVNLDLQKVPALRGSASELGQALHNLIRFSIDSMQDQDDAQLSISTHLADKAVLIEILDNGPGIPEDLLQQASDPERLMLSIGQGDFNQLGLSFYVVRTLFGGDITIHAAHPGTRAIIRLPTAL